jgi:hydrogenase small subunit
MVGQMNGQGVTGYDLLQKLAAKATYVVSVGQCSAFGGIPAGKGNLTGATSVTNALQMAAVTTMNTVVNMPGCPAHPDWTLVGFSPARLRPRSGQHRAANSVLQ